MRILLVEDHLPLAESVAQALRGAGLTVDVLHDGVAAEHALASEDYALAVLDVGLPRLDGFEVLARVRERGKTLPVLMLTARGEVKDRVHGLDLGADDYLAKPFELTELEARVKALLRRAAPETAEDPVELGGIRLEPATFRVFAGETPLNLSPTEFRLLHFFMKQPDRVLSRARLLDNVWGDHVFIEERTVDVHIRRLRLALQPTGHDRLIETVRGGGYRFLPG